MVRIHLGLPPLLWVSDAGDDPLRRLCLRRVPGAGGPGDVAQLVEHLVCNQEVVGSNPIVSTSLRAPAGLALEVMWFPPVNAGG